jgi:hypothetical protein
MRPKMIRNASVEAVTAVLVEFDVLCISTSFTSTYKTVMLYLKEIQVLLLNSYAYFLH